MRPVFVIIAGFAAVALLLGWSRWLAGRRWAAAGNLALAFVLGAAVAGGWPLAAYLDRFEVRRAERSVAEVLFERSGPDRYRATLTRLPSGRMQVVELVGDQWRLDLRTLEWSESAARLGPQPRYRIQILASRQARSAPAGVPQGVTHDLQEGADDVPWLAGMGTRGGVPLTATRDLAGPWQPMAHGARFDVRLTAAASVVVDPLNAAAADSLAVR
jgi:hypothetical protein